jgi:DNA-binding CsgD family transcriptional regulator
MGRTGEARLVAELLDDVRGGRSRVLVVRGGVGIGKTTFLEHVVASASGFQVVGAVGVESEMELAFAGLQQLCVPMLDHLPLLVGPQREAISTALGLAAGRPPDRFLVGLALLSLLAESAEERPVLCAVDDAHWLDRSSAQALAFVARRVLADRVGLVFCTSKPGELDGLPELEMKGLRTADARDLLASLPGAPLDPQVRERIVAEAGGNPLALLEWQRTLTPAEPSGREAVALTGSPFERIEESFRERLGHLPLLTQRFVLVAAAEPVGDAVVVRQAAERLGVDGTDAHPAVEAGLIELGATVRFRHPVVRSVAYHWWPLTERQRAHGALAEVTDAGTHPDRRAWHRALAAAHPDDTVAEELERSASRAQARGGLVAAAAFLERATFLTAGEAPRARRALAAAQAKVQIGAFEDARSLLATAEDGPLGELERARADVVRAQLAFATRHITDASLLLLKAAKRLEPVDAVLARQTYLDAMNAATFAGRLANSASDVVAVAQAAEAAPPPPGPRSAADLLLDGLVANVTRGYAAALPALRAALGGRASSLGTDQELRWLSMTGPVAYQIWDDDRCEEMSLRYLQLTRDLGALSELPGALTARAFVLLYFGDLVTAASLIEEEKAAAEATGSGVDAYGATCLAALRGNEAEASALIDKTLRDALLHGEGVGISIAEWASAVLHNGLGHYPQAMVAARSATTRTWDGFSNLALSELVESASRMGDTDAAVGAHQRLSEVARACGTDWVLGLEWRSRALLADGEETEDLYLESIARLGGTRVRGQLARAHLLYGEWLRRENRRVDAREQLRTAYEMLSGMGIAGFAERARRELQATGETVHKRTSKALIELTPQEDCIARLAVGGQTNAEIGAQLFLSARTVEWHLRKVFSKLGASSRRDLRKLLSDQEAR